MADKDKNKDNDNYNKFKIWIYIGIGTLGFLLLIIVIGIIYSLMPNKSSLQSTSSIPVNNYSISKPLPQISNRSSYLSSLFNKTSTGGYKKIFKRF